jgi:hypothetical protein
MVVSMASPASDRISDFGLDAVCEAIADGKSMTALAQDLGVSFGTLSNWIAAGDERSARVRDVRQETARFWDEAGSDGIRDAKDPFELAKAKELAYHYRWRASKISPRDYGDKTAVEHSGAIDIGIAGRVEAARKRSAKA